MRLLRQLPPFFFALIVFISCGPAVVYEETHSVGDKGWSYADTPQFAFTIEDTLQAYDLEIAVEHTDDFAYENFYLKIHTDLPNGRRTTERISLDLAGDFGVWNGSCRSGTCQLSVPILLNTRYQTPGRYAITLEQNSRDEPLAGVQTVGLRLLKAEVQ